MRKELTISGFTFLFLLLLASLIRDQSFEDRKKIYKEVARLTSPNNKFDAVFIERIESTSEAKEVRLNVVQHGSVLIRSGKVIESSDSCFVGEAVKLDAVKWEDDTTIRVLISDRSRVYYFSSDCYREHKIVVRLITVQDNL